jgi:hypothetical protein
MCIAFILRIKVRDICIRQHLLPRILLIPGMSSIWRQIFFLTKSAFITLTGIHFHVEAYDYLIVLFGYMYDEYSTFVDHDRYIVKKFPRYGGPVLFMPKMLMD